jgi:uncharacterized protein YhaN
MKFRRLSLLAFGSFENRSLDFSGVDAPGLHVVYGPNEAGKSTALRAVMGLLFGMPRITADAHRHVTRELRVGATLQRGDGTRLEVVRRKRDKDSLRDPDDAPLAESTLQTLLGGIDQDTFAALYGFDHEGLRRGGRLLIEGRADVGETLYDAALGGHGITRVIEELRGEIDELFRSRSAKKPKLNAALEAYRQLAADHRQQIVPCQAWWQQSEGCEAARREVERLERERRERDVELRRLERIRAALPRAAKRRVLLDKLGELGVLPRLPERCAQRRQQAVTEHDEAEREIGRLTRERESLCAEREQLGPPDALAASEPLRVELIRDGIATDRQATLDLAHLRTRIRASEEEAATLLKQLGKGSDLDRAEELRLTLQQIADIRQRAAARGALDARLEAAEQRARETSKEVARRRASLATLADARDCTSLELALKAAAGVVAIEQEISSRAREAAALDTAAQRALEQLGRFGGSLEELSCAALPDEDAVDDWQRRRTEADEHERRVRGELADRLAEASRTRSELDALELTLDLPDEAQLAGARAARSAAWALVKRAWLEGADVTRDAQTLDPQRPLEQAFEQLVTTADGVADRLRREAFHVGERARLQARLAQLGRDVEALQLELARALRCTTVLDAEWSGMWAAARVEAASCRAMQAWLRRARELVRTVETMLAARAAAAACEQRLKTMLVALCAELAAFGVSADASNPASAVVALAEKRLVAMQELTAERRALQASLIEYEQRYADAERELSLRQQELQAWRHHWSIAVQPLGLPAHAEPADALAVLDAVAQLLQRLDAIATDRRRADGIERRAREFAEQVASLASAYAPDLVSQAPAVAGEHLVRRFKDGRVREERRRDLGVRIVALEHELEAQNLRRAAAAAELSALLAGAALTSVEQLLDAEARHQQLTALSAELTRTEAELLDDAGAATIEEVETSLAGWDRVTVQARLEELADQIETLNDAHKAAAVRARDLDAGLERFGLGQAAETGQELESAGAAVKLYLERYTRAKLSLTILEREIARYRERHQGPVLARASELFPRLTLGHYVGLRVGLEEKALRCVRFDGVEVETAGLSEGAAYQLYFALRVATIERQLSSTEPLPIVLDDVLIHFDEDRAAVALQILAELAERTQVLLFTHHKKLLDVARAAVPARLLGTHELSAPPVHRTLTLLSPQ